MPIKEGLQWPVSICRRHTALLKMLDSLRGGAWYTVYPKKYAHGFCFVVLCCGYTLTDFPISIRLTSLALWQSNDCPSASKATVMNMDKYFMWIHYERLHNHNKAKHNKTVCIFLGIYCSSVLRRPDRTGSFAVRFLPVWCYNQRWAIWSIWSYMIHMIHLYDILSIWFVLPDYFTHTHTHTHPMAWHPSCDIMTNGEELDKAMVN